MPLSSVRLIGNTVFALIVLSFVAPWAIAQRWPSTAGLAGPSKYDTMVSAEAGGIPPRVLQAIMSAADTECRPPWYVLAGISKVESNHADGGKLDAQGNTIGIIGGPYIAWLDTEALGPFQFIPSSWDLFGAGGNPHNVNDAARAAVRHLCSSGGGRVDSSTVRQALYGYNQSWDYVDTVLGWAERYRLSTPVPAAANQADGPVAKVAAFYTAQSASLKADGKPMLGSTVGIFGSFWSWMAPTAPHTPPQLDLRPPSGQDDPECPGRVLTADSRFQAPPGTTTPHMTAQVARALRARFGVDSGMLRSVADRNASAGAATCSDHLWGGALDTDPVVMAWVRPWEGRIFRFITDDYADGHAHLSMLENIAPTELEAFLVATCSGYDCPAQASWDPPAQFSHYGEGSLHTLAT